VSAPRSLYHDKTWYFCTPEHKVIFDRAPQQFLGGSES